MLACVAASVVAALRWDRTHPGVGVLLGGLALFLGPRSLLEYIAGAGVLLVCVVATPFEFRSDFHAVPVLALYPPASSPLLHTTRPRALV